MGWFEQIEDAKWWTEQHGEKAATEWAHTVWSLLSRAQQRALKGEHKHPQSVKRLRKRGLVDDEGNNTEAGAAVLRAGSELWCVHVEGPDSLIPQPDRETAERRAKEWNSGIALSGVLNHENSPHIHCKAIPWAYTAASHAASLAEHGGQPSDIC